MSEKWPSERLAEERQPITNTSFKTVPDFLALLNAFPNGFPEIFDEVVSWIMKNDGDFPELEQRISAVIEAEELQSYLAEQPMLMTLACAIAISRAPTLRMWSRINTFRYNSWELENWLGEALLAFAKVQSSACECYVALAEKVFFALDDFSLNCKSDRINQERYAAWASWTQQQEKLEEIWRGLRDWNGYTHYRMEIDLFRVSYDLKPDDFLQVLARSSNPYLVSASLLAAGVGAFLPQFSNWKRLLMAAPVAFGDEGEWNGSVLIPLLLVEAREQLLQARQNLRASDFTPVELERLKKEIVDTAELIATELVARLDAPAIISRWTPWLMRNLLNCTSKEVEDVKSSAFVDDAMIDAIGQRLGNLKLPESSPAGAASWEPWCYRCVLSTFAYNGHIPLHAWEAFGSEWHLEPEDWASKKGRLLRDRASLITTMSKETPGTAAHSLAYPLTQSSSPGNAWVGMWNDAITLREIVEFGDSDAISDEYSSRADAGRLLLLLFRIGLAIFDQCAARCSNIHSPEAELLVCLYRELLSAVHEMSEIDSTLNHEEWRLFDRHLTVRRMIWDQPSSGESQPRNFQVFKRGDTPTVVGLLAESKNDVIELFAVLQSLLLNSSDISRLKDDLDSALISLPDTLSALKTLNEIQPRKYPINIDQFEKLSRL